MCLYHSLTLFFDFFVVFCNGGISIVVFVVVDEIDIVGVVRIDDVVGSVGAGSYIYIVVATVNILIIVVVSIIIVVVISIINTIIVVKLSGHDFKNFLISIVVIWLVCQSR